MEPYSTSKSNNLLNKSNFIIRRINCVDLEELNDVILSQFLINQENKNIEKSCGVRQILKKSLQNLSYNKIIPNKLKSFENFSFFTFLEVDQINNPAETKIIDFKFYIFKNSILCKENLKKQESDLMFDSTLLNINIPTKFSQPFIGFKYLSNFYIVNYTDFFIAFLTVFNVVKVIKIFYDNKYEILFQKKFTDISLLLLIGSEIISDSYKFYLLSKSGQNMVIFNCDFSNKKSTNSEISFKEINLHNLFLNSNLNLVMSKVIVINNSETLFYDKINNSIYLINEEFQNLRKLENIELKNFTNFLVLQPPSPSTQNNLTNSTSVGTFFIITDEVIDKNFLIIYLWKIKKIDNNTNIQCEKIQSIYIESENSKGILEIIT